MAFPDTLLSNQWGADTDPPSFIAPSSMNTRIDQWLNALATRLMSNGGGWIYGEADGTTANTVTLATVSTDFLVPAAAVTVTTTVQRRFRVLTAAGFTMASGTAGAYALYASYVAGASATLTGAVKLGQTAANTCLTTIVGGGGRVTETAEHTVLLAAGTWTFFPIGQRTASGSATDTASLGHCIVYDSGNV